MINEKFEDTLRSNFNMWVKDKGNKLLDTVSIIANSKYQYSYLIKYNLVDVYETRYQANGDTISAFFRMENNIPLFPYDDDGWVIISGQIR